MVGTHQVLNWPLHSLEVKIESLPTEDGKDDEMIETEIQEYRERN